jgi:pyruvate/2-oxoglutarate dehydrogenase complex dihydrolipoamide acyltransferase (E2) component
LISIISSIIHHIEKFDCDSQCGREARRVSSQLCESDRHSRLNEYVIKHQIKSKTQIAIYIKLTSSFFSGVAADGKDLSLEGLGGVGGDARQTLPKAVAKFEYKATKATELSFHKGDTIVEVRKMAGEWWRGSCNGQRGYFPKSYVAVVGEGVIEAQRGNVFHSEKPPLARAMFDFVGQSEQELTFKEGDVIGQVNEGADKSSPWWQGTRGGRTGYFPREYVAMVDQKRRKTPYTANVVYRFDARDPKSQLSLVVGEMIEVLELCDEITGGWWVGRKSDNKIGYFPANYARYTAKTCEKCQTRAAKAKVTMGPQRTVHWFCRTCVQSMDASARPPKAAGGPAAAAAKPPVAASQPIAAAAKAATPAAAAAAVATSPPKAAALPPAPVAAPAPGGNDAASARLAALGMVPKAGGTPKGAASPVVSRPAAVQQQPPQQQQAAAKLPPPPAAAGGVVLPPPPSVVGGGAGLPPPPAAAAQPLRQSRNNEPVPQRKQESDDDDDDDDDSEDTDDVSTDDEDEAGGGGGLTYVEMLRQEYRKHLPAPEDMRADFGKAPAPPRPDQ